MTDVLLINPPQPDPTMLIVKKYISCPPIGLGYIASILIANGFTVHAVDMEALEIRRPGLINEIKKHKPIIVGISSTTLTYKNALRIAKIVKDIDEGVITILGGPHVTFTDEETVRHPEVDIVVRNEGELSMKELCKFYIHGEGKLEDIKGITYTKKGQVIQNVDQILLKNLDNLPFPALHIFPLLNYTHPGIIVTSRGCPYNCIFCSAGVMSGGQYRARSIDNVMLEFKKLTDTFHLKNYFISDNTFTVNKKRVNDICAGIKDLETEIHWAAEARVNTVDKEMLNTMVEAGCTALQYGVESGSQRILNSVSKNTTLHQIRNAVKWTTEVGMVPVCTLMIPHHQDTEETVYETKQLITELRSYGARVFIGFTTPFPGTYLFDHAPELGINVICEDTDLYNLATPVVDTNNLPLERLRQLYIDLIIAALGTTETEDVEQSLSSFDIQKLG